MNKTLYAGPAYFRSYKTESDVLRDWNDGKDFKIVAGGPYFSNRDIKLLKDDGYTKIEIAFALIKTCHIDL